MPRSIPPVALLFLAVVGLVQAAPVPKARVKDYQKLADETEWQFAKFDFNAALAAELKGYEVKGLWDKAGATINISNDKKERLLTWETHRQAPFAQRDGVLYYTVFSPWSDGCSVVAFDLSAKKQLWKADLKGLGGIDHSKYRNEVRMEMLDGDTLQVFGKESAGKYVEFVDRSSGKTVGHKVFKDEK